MKKSTIEINIPEIEKKIGYTFTDKSLLIQAFTRTSFCNEVNPTARINHQSNEVLEFFGDGVLSVAIISFLLKECTQRYAHGIKTELTEGYFSNIKSKLSDKQNLSKSTKALGLEKYLQMGEGDAKLGIQNEPSVMEDLFESIVGAIYIDSNMSMDAVIKSVSGMLDMSVYTDKQKPMQSAKNALQEWCADKKRRLPAPRYETLSEDGPDHKKTYMRACYIGDRLMGRGVGKNFKIADAAAAEDALNKLMAENNEDLTTKVDNISQFTEKTKAATKKPKPVTAEQSESGVSQTFAALTTTKTTVKKHASHLAVLKSLAVSQKKPSPSFRDLGQISTKGSVEYHIECIFDSNSVVGIGKSRIEARENAAKLMADKLAEKKKKPSAQKMQLQKNPDSLEKPQKNSDTSPAKSTKNANASATKKHSQHRRHYTKKRTTRTAKTK